MRGTFARTEEQPLNENWIQNAKYKLAKRILCIFYHHLLPYSKTIYRYRLTCHKSGIHVPIYVCVWECLLYTGKQRNQQTQTNCGGSRELLAELWPASSAFRCPSICRIMQLIAYRQAYKAVSMCVCMYGMCA